MYPTTTKLAKYVYKIVEGPSGKKERPAKGASSTPVAVQA
jgi:hypothetical protein